MLLPNRQFIAFPTLQLQVVKVKSDGSFYVTNHKLNKKQADKIILEGQVIYDLSSLSDT